MNVHVKYFYRHDKIRPTTTTTSKLLRIDTDNANGTDTVY